ncbi:hypothetical protein RND71_000705 [Anisodus tanguticus]|uniref:Uncharacterized protein n=1 Tax=Anisodus tanguticus TaxID=243964 RepID=A0AAE1T033_9SOLA|nr:hypothetical protein RND71_000705 [Anisodus tanguticus]
MAGLPSVVNRPTWFCGAIASVRGNLNGFITHEVNFQDINKAFYLLEASKTMRCIIWMDK